MHIRKVKYLFVYRNVRIHINLLHRSSAIIYLAAAHHSSRLLEAPSCVWTGTDLGMILFEQCPLQLALGHGLPTRCATLCCGTHTSTGVAFLPLTAAGFEAFLLSVAGDMSSVLMSLQQSSCKGESSWRWDGLRVVPSMASAITQGWRTTRVWETVEWVSEELSAPLHCPSPQKLNLAQELSVQRW